MQIGCFSVLTKESWGRANKSFPRHVSEVNETRERERNVEVKKMMKRLGRNQIQGELSLQGLPWTRFGL